MKKKEGMLFATSYKGYNKEDVNQYILQINNQLHGQAQAISNSNEQLNNMYLKIDELSAELLLQKENNNSLNEQLSIIKAEKEDLENQLNSLKVENEELYTNLCNKTGEIILIASDTAEDIIKKANDVANAIVDNVYTKKESSEILKNYIDNAFENCSTKVNESIDTVDIIKTNPKIKKPRIRFINGI